MDSPSTRLPIIKLPKIPFLAASNKASFFCSDVFNFVKLELFPGSRIEEKILVKYKYFNRLIPYDTNMKIWRFLATLQENSMTTHRIGKQKIFCFFYSDKIPDKIPDRDNWITSVSYCIILASITFSISLNMNYQPIHSIQKLQNNGWKIFPRLIKILRISPQNT